MQSVGQKLRAVREAQGLTLVQLNASTRISVKLLEAIEADDLGAFSSAFFYKSFVRQVSEALGVVYSELESSVRARSEQMPVPLVPGERNAQPKIGALRMGRRKNSRLAYSITSFAVVLVACSGVYGFWQNVKLSMPHAWQTSAGRFGSSKTSPAMQIGQKASEAASQTEDRASVARVPEQTITGHEVVNGFKLELSATEPAWLSIVADGKESFNGILERAETKILEGHHTARVRTGNAGGVKVVFNGKSIGALGARGQVRTVLFTKNNYEVLQSPDRVSLIDLSQTAELKPALDLTLLPGF